MSLDDGRLLFTGKEDDKAVVFRKRPWAAQRRSRQLRRRGIVGQPELLEPRALLATIQWDGGPTGDGTEFLLAENWIGDVLPGATDTAVIGPTGTNSAITLSDQATVAEIRSSRNIQLTGGTIIGARIVGVGGSRLIVTNTLGNLLGVTMAADLDLETSPGATVRIANGLTLENANIRLGSRAGDTFGQISFTGGSQTLGGTGTVVFGSSPSNIVENFLSSGDTPTGVLTIAPGITLRGNAGQIGAGSPLAPIINQGTIAADASPPRTGDPGYDLAPTGGSSSAVGPSSVGFTQPIDTSAVIDPLPESVYRSYRFGSSFTYTLPGLAANTTYTVRLHFMEPDSSASTGSRLINVDLNGSRMLSDFDIFTTAGAAFKAVVREFPVASDAAGRITAAFSSTNNAAIVNGIEVVAAGGARALVVDAGLAPGTLSIAADTFLNQGTISATNGETLAISGMTGDAGVVRIAAGSSLVQAGPLTSDTTTPANLLLSGTTRISGGDASAPSFFEAASADMGPVLAGLSPGNFGLGTLRIADSGYVRLQDIRDNSSAPGAEAVYVDTLVVDAGATLDLNGIRLYVRSAQISGTVIGSIINFTDIPAVQIVSEKSSLGFGQTAALTFSLNRPSTTFTRDSISRTGGELTNFSGSGTTYSATFVPQPNFVGSATLQVAAEAFTDTAGFPNVASAETSISVNTVLPTVDIVTDKSTLRPGETASLTFTLSEPAAEFTADKVTVTGGRLQTFTGFGTTYTATFVPEPTFVGTATVAVAAGAFTNVAGNPNATASSQQITVDPGIAGLVVVELGDPAAAAALANSLAGPGVTIRNVRFSGTGQSAGSFSGGLAAGLGLAQGIVLGSGRVVDAVGPNQSDSTSSVLDIAGDLALDALASASTFDATVLEFDVDVAGSALSFPYVFASEEYNEFVNQFNDVFGLFVDGVNVAVLPGTATPVSINTVNSSVNASLYRNNSVADLGLPTPFNVAADGFTSVMKATVTLQPGTHRIKLAVADANDSAFDSWVFLSTGSFVSRQSDLSLTAGTVSAAVTPGTLVTLPFTITNIGAESVTEALFQNMLPAGLRFASVSTSQGFASQTGNLVTASLGNLAPSASATVTVTAEVVGLGTIVNTASLQANEADPVSANNSVATTFFSTSDRPVVAIVPGANSLRARESTVVAFGLSAVPDTFSPFGSADITVSPSVAGQFSQFTAVSPTNYTAVFTPAPDFEGVVVFSVPEGAFTVSGTLGGGPTANLAGSSTTVTIDSAGPRVTLSVAPTSALDQSQTVTIALSEPTSRSLVREDVSVTGGSLTNFTGRGAAYTATFVPQANFVGAATIQVAAGAFTDAAGNPNLQSNPIEIQVQPEVPIDNGLQPSAIGFFGVGVRAGGRVENSTVTALGKTGRRLEGPSGDFIFDYSLYVKVGTSGPAQRLDATTVTMGPTLIAPGVVASEGTFPGPNGAVTWRVESSFNGSADGFVSRVFLRSSQPLGAIRLISYLDEDVDEPGGDVLQAVGTPGTSAFRAFTLDNDERVGFAQSGELVPGAGLVNAAYAGWSADSFSNLEAQIQADGGAYTINGTIRTDRLPPFTDPDLGSIYGPADVTTAFAWTVDPLATSAVMTPFLILTAMDPSAPVVTIVTDRSSLGIGQTAAVTLTLDTPSTTFTAGDVSVTGGTLANFTGSGTAYTATFVPQANFAGTATIRVAAGAFTDAFSNPNTASAVTSIAVDTIAPTVLVTLGAQSLGIGQTAPVAFTLDKPSTTFTAGVVAVASGTLTNFTGSGTTYTATFVPQPNFAGTATIQVAAGAFTDAFGNPNLGIPALPIIVDTRPRGMLAAGTDGNALTGSREFQYTASGPTTIRIAGLSAIQSGFFSPRMRLTITPTDATASSAATVVRRSYDARSRAVTVTLDRAITVSPASGTLVLGEASAPAARLIDATTGEVRREIGGADLVAAGYSPVFVTRFQGGLRVAAGDVDGDSFPDLAAAPGATPLRSPTIDFGRSTRLVSLFSGASTPAWPAATVDVAAVFPESAGEGFFVALGNVTADGADSGVRELVVASGRRVAVFEVLVSAGIPSIVPTPLRVIDLPTPGRVTAVATGALFDPSGLDEIIVASTTGTQRVAGTTTVAVLGGVDLQTLRSFAVSSLVESGPARRLVDVFGRGASLAVGDIDGDGRRDLVLGAGSNGLGNFRVLGNEFVTASSATTNVGRFTAAITSELGNSVRFGHLRPAGPKWKPRGGPDFFTPGDVVGPTGSGFNAPLAVATVSGDSSTGGKAWIFAALGATNQTGNEIRRLLSAGPGSWTSDATFRQLPATQAGDLAGRFRPGTGLRLG